MKKIIRKTILFVSTLGVFTLSSCVKTEIPEEPTSFVKAELTNISKEDFKSHCWDWKENFKFKKGKKEYTYTLYVSYDSHYVKVGYYEVPGIYHHEKGEESGPYEIVYLEVESLWEKMDSYWIPMYFFGLENGYIITDESLSHGKSRAQAGSNGVTLDANAETGDYRFYLCDIRYNGYVDISDEEDNHSYYLAKNISIGTSHNLKFSTTMPSIE